ncbi:unnamed protein product [Penicillium bialowiezense]
MLDIDPELRISASNALAAPYLSAYHDPTDEPVAEHIFDWSPNARCGSNDTWKKELYAEVTFDESATTEHINAYMRKIQENGGSVTNRFPDMIARGFSACITDSVIQELEQDPLIERLAPDGSPNYQASQSFFGIAA